MEKGIESPFFTFTPSFWIITSWIICKNRLKIENGPSSSQTARFDWSGPYSLLISIVFRHRFRHRRRHRRHLRCRRYPCLVIACQESLPSTTQGSGEASRAGKLYQEYKKFCFLSSC